MTTFSGSLSALQTALMLLFSCSAPTGQAMMHWPQLMQGESASERSNTQPMEVEKPRRVAPMAPIFCILLQAAMQRRR